MVSIRLNIGLMTIVLLLYYKNYKNKNSGQDDTLDGHCSVNTTGNIFTPFEFLL